MFRAIRRALTLATILTALAAVVPSVQTPTQVARSSWGKAVASYGTGRAEAVGFQGAKDAAFWEAADFCTPHRFGKCMARRSTVLGGVGNGRWTAQAQSWGCIWYEPCSFNAFNSWHARVESRWYDSECFTIQANGSITGRYRNC